MSISAKGQSRSELPTINFKPWKGYNISVNCFCQDGMFQNFRGMIDHVHVGYRVNICLVLIVHFRLQIIPNLISAIFYILSNCNVLTYSLDLLTFITYIFIIVKTLRGSTQTFFFLNQTNYFGLY